MTGSIEAAPDDAPVGEGAARSSDAYDAVASNGTAATATDLSSAINPTTYTGVVKGLDISATSDVDYYKVTLPTGSSGSSSRPGASRRGSSRSRASRVGRSRTPASATGSSSI